ncbi:MAG TPA: NAD(P)-binding domain-containing protein, partial [Thermoanaerobaculia bacterium]|nr:NAD(P)-binding domain-containing protein [Thermoanaerobaculia bacterium]
EATEGAGSFFTKFPRHRRLISINKVHTGRRDPTVQFRWDWNSLLSDGGSPFKRYSEEYFPPASSMVDYLQDFASEHQLNVHYGQRVVEISRRGGGFQVKTPSQSFAARYLIVATGLSEPYVPPIPGIERAARYADFDADPARYSDRRVLVIGKGNSGFETADSLIPYAAQIHIVSRHDVTMAWNSHHVGHLRAVNNNLIDTDQLKSQNATIWGEVLAIEPYRGRHLVRIAHIDSDRRVFTHLYDDIICCTGFRMSRDIFHPPCVPAMVVDERLPALTAEWESTNVENLFFAGTLTQSRDYKRSSSAFIHGFRYNTQALFRMLALRNGGSWPSRELAKDADSLTNFIAQRVNTTSSLWHQFNFLCDVIDLGTPTARCFHDVPVDFALSSPYFRLARCLLLTFTHDEPKDPERRRYFSEVPALHPRVRLVANGEVIAEHHVLEDLEAEWFEESLYLQPLEAFLAAVLAEEVAAQPPPVAAAGIPELTRPTARS